MGEVSTVTGYAMREAIFQEHILEDFLHQRAVGQPLEYVRAGLAQSRQWLPIFFFARLAKLTNAQIAEQMRELKISQKGKKKILLDRLEGKKRAFSKAVTQSAKRIAADISKGVLVLPRVVADVPPFAYGLTAVAATKLPLSDMLSALITCRDIAESCDDRNALGTVYKAACRVDELFFSNDTAVTPKR